MAQVELITFAAWKIIRCDSYKNEKQKRRNFIYQLINFKNNKS